MQDGIDNLENEHCAEDGLDPLSAVSFRLLHKWLGSDLKRFVINNTVSPLLIMTVDTKLLSFLGYWKNIKEDFLIIRENEELCQCSDCGALVREEDNICHQCGAGLSDLES
jgi:hypothetical protein